MKKLFVILACAAFLTSCGSSGESGDKTDSTQVTQELKDMQKSSENLKVKSEELNAKADSILKTL
jgi:hypothetical protein